jgi:hypothetical protein
VASRVTVRLGLVRRGGFRGRSLVLESRTGDIVPCYMPYAAEAGACPRAPH